MFWRMLKKDLADKKGLNIILFLFMCFASILTVASAIVLYANFLGKPCAYKRINAADVLIVSERDLGGTEENRKEILDWFSKRDDVTDVELGQTIRFRSNAVSFADLKNDDFSKIVNSSFYGFDLSMKHDLVTDLDGKFFELPYGTVAVPQDVQNTMGLKTGDKVHVVTQMGNIYEFTIAAFTKDISISNFYRLFFNSEDYQILISESPIVYDVFMATMKEGNTDVDQGQLRSEFKKKESDFGKTVVSDSLLGWNGANDGSYATNACMIIVSVFLIFMVFMTVSFTIKTAIKNEEKELGMLKALGVESASFNWLFAAKYLAFSLAGTVVGFFGGIYLAGIYVKYLAFNLLKPEMMPMIVTALIAALAIFLLIILFVAFALRRMKKISIIDVIAGENRGERFRALPGFFLHKIRNINIPLYLALTDLITKIKRYSFLILAYVMGITLVILCLELENTTNREYWITKYWGQPHYDFAIDLPDDLMQKYIDRGGNVKGAYDIMNEEIKAAGIPAEINYHQVYGTSSLIHKGKTYETYLEWNASDKVNRKLYQGVNPVLRNEVIVDAYHANLCGIAVGDTLNVSYYKFSDDGLTSDLVSEDFIVVGLYDGPEVYLAVTWGDAFEGCARGSTLPYGCVINAPKDQHPHVIEQLRELFGKGSIRDYDEHTAYCLKDLHAMWNLILTIIIPFIVVLMIMVTVLYMSVNIQDEVPEIALLKSCGFTNGSIKGWQIIRGFLILISSAVIAIIFDNTVALFLVTKLYNTMGHIVRLVPNRNILSFYVVIPVLIIVSILLVLSIVLKKVNQIELWRIRND